MQEINKVHSSGPHLSLVILIIIESFIFDENIQFFPHLHGVLIVHRYSYVKQRHKVNLMFFHHFIELVTSMGVGTDSEDHLFVHVVEI